MKLPLFLDRILHRFNPMDDTSRTALTTDFMVIYDKCTCDAKLKRDFNEANKNEPDFVPEKLTTKEKIYSFLDRFEVRYLLALLYAPLVAFFTKNQQINEPDDLDDEDDDDEDFDPEQYRKIIKLLKRKI